MVRQLSEKLRLRQSTPADLDLFFQFQLDKEAQHLAAFMPKNPNDKDAYLAKYTKHLNDPTITTKTILVDKEIAGSIAKFEIDGEAEITYWIDKKFWGKDIASTALKQFLMIELIRPICGRVAFDNYASQKVLEKCGFVKVGVDKGFANARGEEIEEFIYMLS